MFLKRLTLLLSSLINVFRGNGEIISFNHRAQFGILNERSKLSWNHRWRDSARFNEFTEDLEFCPSCCKAPGFVILVFRSNAFCVCFFLKRSLLSSVLHCMRWPWVPNLTPLPLLPAKDETCDGLMGSSPESCWRHMFFCYKTSTKHVQSLVQRCGALTIYLHQR